MPAQDLTASYLYAGDVITIFICLILMIVIKKVLYFSDDKNFEYMRKSVHFVILAAISNIIFGAVCKYSPDSKILIFLLRDIYHISLISTLYIFIEYTLKLLDMNENITRKNRLLTRTVFSAGIFMDVLSPFTHFGFYEINSLWYDHSLFKPYTILYVFAMSELFILLLISSGRLILAVRNTLISIEAVAVLMLVFDTAHDSNTFTSFTYTMPVIAVLTLIHSKPYDLNTGAMVETSYNSYYKHTEKNNKSLNFMILKLDLKNQHSVPAELGKIMYNFWNRYFRDALFFSMKNDVFVLAISQSTRNTDIEDKMRKLAADVFPEHYKKFKIPYKIICMTDSRFIKNTQDLRDIIFFLLSGIKYNETLWVDDNLKSKLINMKNVKAILADIDEKCNLNDERILVYCQPVKNMRTGAYDTAESLMRLKGPDGNIIYPDMFISVAEQNGYIHTLSKIILNKVCMSIHDLLRDGYEIQRISVNFSALELREENFCNEIFEIIKSHDIPCEKLGIELTETQNESDYIFVRQKIQDLKEYGIKIYLDDFGTGYSNFEKILSLGLDVIKFDRSLLLCADTDRNVTFTLQHFAQAFKELNYDILFEGVETKGQEYLCSSCGADYLQGYKYSKPVPIEDLRNFLTASVK